MLSIGVTDLQYFSGCRRKWWLEKGWKPPRPSSPYWFGTAVHEGLEVYYKTLDQDKAIQAADTLMKDSLTQISDEFPEIWDQVYGEFEDLYGLVHVVLQNYFIREESESLIDLYGEVRSVEEKIRIPLFKDPVLGPVSLAGKIDLILEDARGAWIVDHKTSASPMDFGGLDVDEQLTGYTFLFYRETQTLPQGVIYNVLVKDLPNPPKVLKDGSLSKDISQKTTYSLYLKELEDRGIDSSEEEYSKVLSVLESKGWSRFFQRDGSTRNLTEVQRFFTRTLRKAQDIAGIMKDPMKNAYPNPSNYTCNYCPFLGVCKSMEDGGDWERVLEARFIPNVR